MSAALPARLRAACEAYAAGLPQSEIARHAAAISDRYRSGGGSQEAVASRAAVAAYLAARLPATYAAIGAALDAACRLMPSARMVSFGAARSTIGMNIARRVINGGLSACARF